MSYMALYRKFRPTEFDDVKGQEHIVTTLKNQIRAERIGHAEFRSRAEKSISGDAYAQGYRHGKEFNPTKRLQEA